MTRNYFNLLTPFIKNGSLILLIFALCESANGQTIPVGSLQDEQLQLESLLQDSIAIYPINRPSLSSTYHQTYLNRSSSNKWWERPLGLNEYTLTDHIDIGIQPFSIQNTINTRLPYGENNGAAWYGRGNNTELKGGFYLKSRYATLNVQPHIIYQQNKDFLRPGFIPGDGQGNIRYVAEGIWQFIDAPFRFGPDPYNTFDWGNSSFRLHHGKFEAGVSSEALWWGGMARYPLLMSNNAPGIPHAFVGSREAIHIPYAGSFQFKWIFGYPQKSGYYDGEGAGNTRITNAINIKYQPKLFDNITLGFTRLIHSYQNNGFQFSDVTDIVNPFQSGNQANLAGIDQRNQMASMYVHMLFPEANAEIFGEFLREDFSFDSRDFINEPHHNSGYAFGFQKISHVPYVDFVKTHLEFTNLTTSQLKQVRPQTYIYSHTTVRQGHTSRGQIMGAAIGPGSNSQYLGIDGYKNNFKLGFFVQRLVDNDNFHFQFGDASLSPSNFGDYFRHRVDLNVGLNFLYGPGPFYINSRLAWTKAYNYGRFDLNNLDETTIQNFERNDRINLQFQIGITYVL